MRKATGTSLILFLASVLVPARGLAGPKDASSYALVAGTVFQGSGYALPGAEVSLTPTPEPDGPPVKGAKKLQAVASARGEFAFRVAPGPMHYVLKASAKGFQSQEKPVEIQGEERVDVTFQLQAQSK